MQASLEHNTSQQKVAPFEIGKLLYLQQRYQGKPSATPVMVEELKLDSGGWTAKLRVRTQKGPTDVIVVPEKDFPLLGNVLPKDWSVSAVLGPK